MLSLLRHQKRPHQLKHLVASVHDTRLRFGLHQKKERHRETYPNDVAAGFHWISLETPVERLLQAVIHCPRSLRLKSPKPCTLKLKALQPHLLHPEFQALPPQRGSTSILLKKPKILNSTRHLPLYIGTLSFYIYTYDMHTSI